MLVVHLKFIPWKILLILEFMGFVRRYEVWGMTVWVCAIQTAINRFVFGKWNIDEHKYLSGCLTHISWIYTSHFCADTFFFCCPGGRSSRDIKPVQNKPNFTILIFWFRLMKQFFSHFVYSNCASVSAAIFVDRLDNKMQLVCSFLVMSVTVDGRAQTSNFIH